MLAKKTRINFEAFSRSRKYFRDTAATANLSPLQNSLPRAMRCLAAKTFSHRFFQHLFWSLSLLRMTQPHLLSQRHSGTNWVGLDKERTEQLHFATALNDESTLKKKKEKKTKTKVGAEREKKSAWLFHSKLQEEKKKQIQGEQETAEMRLWGQYANRETH